MNIIIIYLLFICIIAIYIKIKAEQDLKVFKKCLKNEFGSVIEKQYSQEQMELFSRYFKNKQQNDNNFVIDDTTWDDLDMDRIFARINHAQSLAGEEYLYSMLRNVEFQKEQLIERDELSNVFMEDEETRIKFQVLYKRLGRLKKFSVSDFIYNTINLNVRKTLDYKIQAILALVSIFLFIIKPMPFIIFMFGMIAQNINTSFSRRREIEHYLNSISYIVKMMYLSHKIIKINYTPIDKYNKMLMENLQIIHKIKRNMKYVKGGSGSGSIIDALMDYVRMIFLVDIIKYEVIVQQILKYSNEIKNIYDILGYIESMISVASYKKSLSYYANPQLVENGNIQILVKDIYHPLICNPITNSIYEQKSIMLTGSNASGKSTFLKTIGINAILAQSIYIVTAKEYTAPYYKVITSMSLRDSLQKNESYYIAEIKSLKRIIDNMEKNIPILCCIDEVLRGTNTIERISASTYILKDLGNSNCLCFVATHDIELTTILSSYYSNYHFQEEIKDGDVIFDYRLYAGRSTSRNAIELLRIMGYNKEIVQNAYKTASNFENTRVWDVV